MIAIPFPFIVAEIVIFWLAVQEWGFWNTLGLYFLPCLLGVAIISVVGRMAMMNLQNSMMRGQLPGNRLLHSGAIFLSGLLFVIPSFFSRVAAVVLFLPGLRHLAVWRFKAFMAKQIAKGSASAFSFGAGGPFGFGMGSSGSGFRYYEYRNGGSGFQNVSEVREEREVRDAQVLDVTPLEITHEEKKSED